MASSVTRTLAIGERMHQLKLFFSNRFVYAHVIRKTDGHVRGAPSFLPSSPPAPSPITRAIP